MSALEARWLHAVAALNYRSAADQIRWWIGEEFKRRLETGEVTPNGDLRRIGPPSAPAVPPPTEEES